jgi:hypothetical protein
MRSIRLAKQDWQAKLGKNKKLRLTLSKWELAHNLRRVIIETFYSDAEHPSCEARLASKA